MLFIHLTLHGQMHVLNVPEVIQEQDQWCWAGVSSCILQYYGVDINQCTIAEYARTHTEWGGFGSVNCCDDPSQGCNNPNSNFGSGGSIQAILQNWGVANYGYLSYLSLPEIQNENASSRPYVIFWQYTTGGGHFLVGYGFNGTRIYYMDPWFGEGYSMGDYNWVVSASDHAWLQTNILTTNYVDNPLPPSDFSAYSDYLTPTSVVLHWTDPVAMRSLAPVSNFKIHIYRDSVFVAEVDSGVRTYTDQGLTTHTLYNYRARTVVPSSPGSAVLASCFAGGSAIPRQPTALRERDGVEGAHLVWKNPSRQVDGTPLNDLYAILVYRDGMLVDSLFQGFVDTGQIRSYMDGVQGYHWYVLRARDSENPVNISAPSDSILAFGRVESAYEDDFEAGAGALYRKGSWDTTHGRAYSGIASLTDSPLGNAPGGTISYVFLPPVLLREESSLRFYHIAILNPASSLGSVDISTDGRQTFKQLGLFTWASYGEWSDSVADPGDWKEAVFDLRPYLYDTVTVRMRLVTTTGFIGDGWYFDSMSIGPSNPVMTVSASAAAGWNLLSLPVRTSRRSYKDLYPGAASPAFTYNGAYEYCDSLSPGVGFWLKFDTNETFQMTGRMLTLDSIPGVAGWNLIGGLTNEADSTSISTRPANIISSEFYQYDGGYSPVNVIEPGRGYWVRLRQAGALIFRTPWLLEKGAGGIRLVSDCGTPEENSIFICDAEGHAQQLTFGTGDGKKSPLEMYDLPPLPPEGLFDVRFQSQRSRAIFDRSVQQEYDIVLQGIHYPVTLRWDIRQTQPGEWELLWDSTRIRLWTGGSAIFTVKPSRAALFVLPADGVSLPQSYLLWQNYPNPFNPVTTIRYQLPVVSYVRLKVLNVLGQVVQILVNGEEGAGYKSVIWDGTDCPSGIYFYTLDAKGISNRADSFSQSKKMILVK